jgi:hypothetical protein
MKVVRFKNGKYGVRRLPFPWMHYLFVTKNGFWYFEEDAHPYCEFDSIFEAEEAVRLAESKKPDNGKVICKAL